VYCFDTDVISALLKARPPIQIVRRLARTGADEQFTTSITVGELVYGAERRGSPELAARIVEVLRHAQTILPFDRAAAEMYGSVRAELERRGRRLAEPDLRIAAISLSRGLTLVTGNVRHFARVPGLLVENWLE
jgi:tRNA(fMet)-specific endonuclease VapC